MSYRLKIIITSVSVFIVMAAIVFFVVLPLLDQIDKSSKEFIQSRSRLNRIEHANEDLSRLMSELDNYKDLQGDIQNLFVPQEKLVDLLTALEGMAKNLRLNYNLQLLSSPDSSQMNFQLSIGGGFLQVARFVNGLENLPFLNQVTRLQIVRTGPISGASQAASASSSTPVTATINIIVFSKS